MTLSSAFNSAVQWQLMESNPCDRVKPPKPKKKAKIKHLNIAQTEAFLKALDEPYDVVTRGRVHKDGTPSKEFHHMVTVPFQLKVFFQIALFCGMRRGEILALTWDEIDFEHRVITVEKSTAKTRSGQVTKSPKSETSYRKIAVSADLISLLRKLQKDQLEQRLRLGSYWEDQGWLFTQDNGHQMDLDTPNKVFKGVIARYNTRCEKEEDRLPADITLHGLRHTSATLLIAEHVDVKSVSRYLGHAETSTTMNIYAHALDEALKEIPNAFDKMFTKCSPEQKNRTVSNN